MQNSNLKMQNVIKNAKCRYWSFLFLHYILIFAICILNFPIKKIYAIENSVVISKIAPFEQSGYEWIEIANRSEQPVDTERWKFWEDGANHGWNLAQGDDLILDSGERAVIVQDKDKYLENNPDYKGVIIDSAWSSLKESGEEIGLKNSDLEAVEIFNYIECPDNVLERINIDLDDYSQLNWQERINTDEKQNPPVGGTDHGSDEENEEYSVENNQNSNSESVISENPFPISVNPFVNKPPVAIIGGDSIEINAGDTIFFDGSDSFDEDGGNLEYFWDFGDGSEGEDAQVEHTYNHFGKFSAILRVSDGEFTASDAMWVNVSKIEYSAEVHINSILPNPAGPDNDNEWIEICNNGEDAADLSGWILDDIANGGSKEYKIKSAEINAGECAKFYRKETKIALNNNGDDVVLMNPAGDIADQISYSGTVNDDEIIFQETRGKRQETNKAQSSKSFAQDGSVSGGKIQINSKAQVLTPEILEKPISNLPDSVIQAGIEYPVSDNDEDANKLINQLTNKQELPLAIKTGDVKFGTLDGELVKVAGTVSERSGNVFFINDGSGEIRIWAPPELKKEYLSIKAGDDISAEGIISNTKVGYRIILKSF